MFPTYLPSLIWLSLWHVALKLRVAMETKIKIPHLLKIEESSASCRRASGWLDHSLQ